MSASPRHHIQTQNFPRLTFNDHFKRAAANFTVRGEPLRRDAGVYDCLKGLTAERALDVFGDLHGRSLTRPRTFSNVGISASGNFLWKRFLTGVRIGLN